MVSAFFEGWDERSQSVLCIRAVVCCDDLRLQMPTVLRQGIEIMCCMQVTQGAWRDGQ